MAPAARATWSVMSPTAPSPTIATESPRRIPAFRTARTATSVVSMSAASSSPISSGSRTQHIRAGTFTYSARPPSPWSPMAAQETHSAYSWRRQ